jgi:Zn-dependent protease
MFRDSNPIAEFRGPWGVPVQIGASLILLPLIMVDFGGSPRSLAFDLMFLAILLGSILLHELGHAWGCLIQGVPVRRVMLYGGGGFCERTRSASRHEQELIVAMGPIVNLLLWAVAGLIAPLIQDPETAWVFRAISSVNGFLALLNLLPVQPLDGGRLFELAMHRVFAPRTASLIAGVTGLLFAIVWIPMMLWGFMAYGFVLFFVPSVIAHWRMLRQPRRA